MSCPMDEFKAQYIKTRTGLSGDVVKEKALPAPVFYMEGVEKCITKNTPGQFSVIMYYKEYLCWPDQKIADFFGLTLWAVKKKIQNIRNENKKAQAVGDALLPQNPQEKA
jgi:hypothetical protein